ncbi:MAG: replicative DNA helicase [Candidatus Bathyarchaeota archaeon]
MINDQLPPHDVEAEEAVIGSLLIDGDAILEISTSLKSEDFFTQQNRWAYEACVSIYERHEGINQITVAHDLAQRGRLEEVGGAAYLSQLISQVPTSLHVKYYADIVSRLSIMRRLISAANKIAAIGYEAEPDIDKAINDAENILFKVRERHIRGDLVPLRSVLTKYFEETELAPTRGEQPEDKERKKEYILTGFNALDNVLIGMQRSALLVLAARPSIGKTSLALNIARNAALNQKACVALFSLEMSQDEVAQRLLSSESDISSVRVRLGNFTEEQESKILEVSGILSDAPIYIDDSPQLRVVEIRSKARRLHFEHPIGLIIVDYIQLIRGEGRIENRVQEISEITRSLKALAKELNVPVLAVSQLSRAVELRISHKPQLSDLRDSGSIEQDADVVLFIHRDEKYYKEEEWAKHSTEPYPRGIADVIIAKNRNGPIDEVKLEFEAKFTKFKNPDLETMPLPT